MPRIINKAIERLKKLKNKEIYLIVIVIAALLFVCCNQISFGGSNNKVSSNAFSPSEYAKTLENKLEGVLGNMDGVGRVSAVITVASGMESVPMLKEDGTLVQSGGKPVILKESYPEIVGVVIVCDGANSYLAKMQVIGAACALLNVSEDRVRVYLKAS